MGKRFDPAFFDPAYFDTTEYSTLISIPVASMTVQRRMGITAAGAAYHLAPAQGRQRVSAEAEGLAYLTAGATGRQRVLIGITARAA